MSVLGTELRDILAPAFSGDTVYGFGGDDLLSGTIDGTTLVGGSGDDLYRLYKSEVTIIEDPDGGHDTIRAWRSLEMPDNVEDLDFQGTGNIQYLRGNDLDNAMVSGDGRQSLAGRRGDDTLTGGTGRDTFFFEAGDGHDRVVDFVPGTDLVTIWGLGLNDLDDLLALGTDTAEGARFAWGAQQSILLEGVALADLTSADFLLDRLPDDFLAEAELTFEDTFDDATSLTDGTWNTQPSNGHPVTAAVSYGKRHHTYVDASSGTADGVSFGIDPFSVEDGVLSIRAQPTPEHLRDAIPEDWVSGQIETHGLFAQTYGYFEIRARTPEGQAFWPAFWLLADNFMWPPEINILEQLGNETHIHRVGAHAPFWGQRVKVNEEHMVPDTSAAFHTYGVLWTPQSLTYTFDDRIMFETETPEGMHEPMALRLNLAIGGWRGEPDESTLADESFDIDHVRVWRIEDLETLPRNTDQSSYADPVSGVLNVSADRPDALYDEVVLRTDVLGTDVLRLASGNGATMVGGAAANLLTGNDEGTVLNGGGGDDTLIGAGGDDYLIGGEGADTLDGGAGRDTQAGGTGDDTYLLRRGDGTAAPNQGLIVERPGEGFDRLVFEDVNPDALRSYVEWARWHLVVESLDGPEYFTIQVSPGIGGMDIGTRFEAIEFADGTIWDLTGGLLLQGDARPNSSSGTLFGDTMHGGDGDDSLFGMDGDDEIDGGHGIDDIYGWNGNDRLTDTGLKGGDRLFGEAGEDTIDAGAGIDSVYGGDGDDQLSASTDGDIIYGQNGADMIKGHRAADTLSGGAGNDSLFGANGDDLLEGGEDADRLSGGNHADTLIGGPGDDTLIGGDGDDLMDGGPGRDQFRGGAGSDVFRFVFDEIAYDIINDFEPGERIEIDVPVAPEAVTVTTEGHAMSIALNDTGETVYLRVVGAVESDVFLF